MPAADLKNIFKDRFTVSKAENLSGGCINDCYCLYTDKGKHFVKLNSAKAYPGMFEEEARALRLMASTATIHVPEVIDVGVAGDISFLLLSFITPGAKQPDTMARLGRELARMHQCTSSQFGFEHDNYIGSLPQANTPTTTWADFFITRRLMPQLNRALGANLLSPNDEKDFEVLFSKIPTLFPTEPPALLHGDLWSGNYVVTDRGEAWLIDPATYYGHREMDLAMASLFGGFSSSFFEAYEEVFPLSPGWKQRTDLCNLYPLLVHVNLFGAGYVGQLRSCLRQYI